MPTFEGSLQLAGDTDTTMAAGIRVDGGRLTILAGPADEIGSWSLSRVDIRRKSGAFVLNVEGEQLLISLDDPDGFGRLVDINEGQPPAEKQQKSSRKPKRERPPKAPRAKRSKRKTRSKTDEPIAEHPPAGPVAEPPKPIPSYIVEEPARLTPSYIAEEPSPAPPRPAEGESPKDTRRARKEKEQQGVSLFAALPLSWKIGGVGVLVAIVLGIFLPGVLTAILMLAGMGALLLAVVVDTDSIAAARLPSWVTSSNALVGGIILLVVSALLMILF